MVLCHFRATALLHDEYTVGVWVTMMTSNRVTYGAFCYVVFEPPSLWFDLSRLVSNVIYTTYVSYFNVMLQDDVGLCGFLSSDPSTRRHLYRGKWPMHLHAPMNTPMQLLHCMQFHWSMRCAMRLSSLKLSTIALAADMSMRASCKALAPTVLYLSILLHAVYSLVCWVQLHLSV